MALVNVEGVGLIDFPDGMSGEQINAAIKKDILPQFPELAAKTKRTWGEAATDVGASLTSGVGQLAQLPGQIGKLTGLTQREETPSGLEGIGKQLETFGQESKSATLKGKEQVLAKKVAAADGIASEAWTAFKGTLTDPALLTSFFAEQLPNLAGSWGGGLLARGATKALMRTATEEAIGKAGLRGAIGTGAIQQGADIGSDTYETIFKQLRKDGMDEEEANGIALSKARVAAIEAAGISLASTKLPGGATIERAMAGKGLPGTAGFVKGLVGEAGSEAFEEGLGKFASNVGVQEVFPETSLTKGVGQAAGLGALGGALFGGPAGAISGRQEDARLQAIADVDKQKQDALDAIEAVKQLEDQARRDAFEAEQTAIRLRALQEEAPERFRQSEAYAELEAKVEKAREAMRKADQAKEAYKQSEFHAAQPDLLGDILPSERAEQPAQEAQAPVQQPGQMELPFADQQGQMNLPGMPSPVLPPQTAETPPTRPVTESDFGRMKINKTNTKLREQLLGKDLNDPAQVQEVRDILEGWVQKGRSEPINKGVGEFLDSIPKPLAEQTQDRLKLRRPYGSLKKPGEVLSAEEQDALQSELEAELGQTTQTIPGAQEDVGRTTAPIAGRNKPSVRVPSKRQAPAGQTEQTERRGVVPVGSDVGQPIGREASVQRTLEASGDLNPRQIREFNQARDKYFAGAVDERAAKLDEKRGKPKGDPQEVALKMLAADLSSGENLKEAKRFHRGLPEAAKAYVADEISRLESVENKANAEIDRLDAIKESQQQTAEAQGLGNIREKLTELGSDRLDVRDAIDSAKSEGNQKEATRLLKKLTNLDERIKALEEQLPKLERIAPGQTTEALVNAVRAGNLSAALNAISKDTSGTFNILEKLVSNRLLANKGSLPKIEIVPAGTVKDGDAQYNPFTDTVQINEGQVDSHTVLHETVHGFLHTLIEKFEAGAKNKGIADLKQLYDFIKENHPNVAKEYGMKNLTEFASELMSNRQFQETLAQIPYRTEAQSLFTAFIRAVLNALGLSPTQKLSALAAGLFAADRSIAQGRAVQQMRTGVETGAPVKVASRLDSIFDEAGGKFNEEKSPGPFQSAQNIAKATTKENTKQSINRFLNAAETLLFSSDAALNNAIRAELERNNTDWDALKAMMMQVSTSQALHADAVAMQFLERGDIEYDEKVFKYKAKDAKDSWQGLVKQLSQMAKNHNISMEKASAYARKALEAKRLKGLKESSSQAYIHMSDAQIKAGLEFFNELPELKQIQDSWNKVRENAMKVAVDAGLYSEAQAKELLDIMDYVPFYRVEQLAQKAGPKEYGRGLLDFAKGYKFKGSEQEVEDLFDNMERWVSYTVSRAVKNRTALNLYSTAKELFPDEVTDLRQDARVKKEQNTIDLWVDGIRRKVEFKDPFFVHAFQGMESIAIPQWKSASAVANIFRKNIVLMPLFSISQLSQDSFGAMLTSGLKHPWALPVEVMKEFVKTLRGTSTAAKELAEYGAVGVRDYSAMVARNDAEIAAGLKAPTKLQKVLSPLEKIAMASDNAVRQAVYNMTMKETKGDKATAVERAFEIINFKRSGSSGNMQMLRQVVPFFGAYLQAQNVIYKTLMGKGISPQQRKEAQRVLLSNALKIGVLGFLYAAMSADDDEYQRMDPAIRNKHLLIPGTAFMLPLRNDLTIFPKLIAEYTYLGITENGFTDAKKIRRAMADSLVDAVFSPTVAPQVIKPVLEVFVNYDFFTGRPIEGQSIANKLTAEKFTHNTSELAKFIGSSGIIAPVNVDHILKGYGGTTVGLFLNGTNAIVNAASDQPKPEKSWQDALASTPGLSPFIAREYGNADKNDFYELRKEFDAVNNTFNAMKKQGRIEDAKELLEEKKDILGLKTQINNINRQLTSLRERENIIYELPESKMTAEQKGEEIKKIREQEKKFLGNVHKLRELAGY